MTLPIPHPHATKEQRTKVLTGTDMKRLVEGKWREVWDEKVGNTPPFDSTFIWAMRLGQETEKLHAWWHAHTEKCRVEMCPDRPCFFPDVDVPAHWAATFDFWIPADDCPLELKHRHPGVSLIDYAHEHMPQLQWQLLVSGKPRERFSVIRGNSEPEWGWVDRDEAYIDRLRKMADVFWQLVTDKIAPAEEESPDEEMKEAAKSVPLNGFRKYDYSKNNEWIVKAADYIKLKPQADAFKATDKEIRELIPKDALEVEGGRLRAKRDARGAYRFTIQEES